MMKFIYMILAMILVAVAVMQNLLWLAALFTLLFTAYFGAGALFILAVLIDGYYNVFVSVPVFSLIALVWYFVSELIRARVRIIE